MSVQSQKKSTKSGIEQKSLQETLQEVSDLEDGYFIISDWSIFFLRVCSIDGQCLKLHLLDHYHQ